MALFQLRVQRSLDNHAAIINVDGDTATNAENKLLASLRADTQPANWFKPSEEEWEDMHEGEDFFVVSAIPLEAGATPISQEDALSPLAKELKAKAMADKDEANRLATEGANLEHQANLLHNQALDEEALAVKAGSPPMDLDALAPTSPSQTTNAEVPVRPVVDPRISR